MFRLVNTLLEHGELLVSAILIISSCISVWLIKRRSKRKMKYFTGREAKDEQLVSISEWMNAYDKYEERHTGIKREKNAE
jgi:hypothetical protein